MLRDLDDPDSDEGIWSASKVSFTITTRASENDELIEREYTFARAKGWDVWTFHEFEERRTDDTVAVSDRVWRRSSHIEWNSSEPRGIEIPPEVITEFEELLEVDEVTIQVP